MNEAIIDLQTRVAFQDGIIEQLNQVVTEQQQQIDRLQRQIDKLGGQIITIQDEQVNRPADEQPPHY